MGLSVITVRLPPAVHQGSFQKSTLAVPDLKLLTPAQAANALALQNAMLWFGAAVLAMLLKGRARTHRALACVALASAVAIHCVVTWLLGVNLVTAPNDDLLVVSVMSAVVFIFFAVVDVHAALILIRRPGGEEE
ncbi:uncharacterized protein [Miscanthus floridulus]|uniref:uncharacterized protein n=1 Tax=Miscanthus floridulus TaxID=154761 RepID=UPI0034591656